MDKATVLKDALAIAGGAITFFGGGKYLIGLFVNRKRRAVDQSKTLANGASTLVTTASHFAQMIHDDFERLRLQKERLECDLENVKKAQDVIRGECAKKINSIQEAKIALELRVRELESENRRLTELLREDD